MEKIENYFDMKKLRKELKNPKRVYIDISFLYQIGLCFFISINKECVNIVIDLPFVSVDMTFLKFKEVSNE